MGVRALAVFASAALAGLAGCGARPSPVAEPGFSVVAEFYPLYVTLLNLTSGVAGVRVANLVPPAVGCPEDYALTPEDMKVLSQANVFVINGAGLENYLDRVAALFPQLRVVDASAGLAVMTMQGGPNPHLWVSPAQAIGQVRNIAAALAVADPSHAALYQKNCDAYVARLAALATRLRAMAAGAPVREVVAFHDSLPYLARDLHLEILAVVEPAPGQNPNPRELADIVTRVRASPLPVALLSERDAKNPAAEVLSRELGQPLYSLNTVTAGPLEPATAKDAYFQAMEDNLVVLRSALGLNNHATPVPAH